MTDEPIRIDDLSRIDVRRVVGAENCLYALTASGTVWMRSETGWTALPHLGRNPSQRHYMEPDLRAVDFYMHPTVNDDDKICSFRLRVLDHLGTLWELRYVYSVGYLWDQVPL
jgi:hypothetical protein